MGHTWVNGETITATLMNGLAARGDLPLNVKDYGAKGDGVADDASAMQAALTALPAGGGRVVIPRGTYQLGNAITIPNNVEVVGEGPGSIANFTGATSQGFVVGSNSTARNLKITGTGSGGFAAFGNSTSAGTTGAVLADCVIDNWTFGAYLDRTSNNSQATGYKILRNQFTNCYTASIFGIRGDDINVQGNRIVQPASGRAIEFYGGRGHAITDNRVSGGVVGIAYLFSRSTASTASMFERNVIKGNVVDGFTEEGISFDCHGNTAADVSVVDYDTVASTSGSTVTLASPAWASAGSRWNGYRLAVLTGALRGRAYRITAQANATFTLAALSTVVGQFAAGDQVSIMAAAMNNTIVGNTVDAGNSTTAGIMLWGAAFYNTISGNTVTCGPSCQAGIQVASLNGLAASTASLTGTVGRAPTGGNTVQGNTVQGGPIQLSYTNYGGAADFYSYGNVVTGNSMPGGNVQTTRHQDIRVGNYSGAQDAVTSSPSDGQANSPQDPLGLGLMSTVDLPSSVDTLNANRAIYMRVPVGGTISKIRVHVQTSSGNVCVGVYRNNGATGVNAAPGARAGTSGSVACPASGSADIALTSAVDVNPGDWLAFAADNATAQFVTNGGVFAGSLWAGRAGYQDAAFPLPATATATAGLVKAVGLRGVA